MLSKQNGLWLGAFCVVLSFCATKDQKKEKPLSVYLAYMITGNEDAGMVTGLLQFRSGKNGRGYILKEPSKVELDGEKLEWDTAGISGAFYEFQKPLATFAGEHTIVFTDENGRQYKEQFTYTPFSLEADLQAEIKREQLVLPLTGLPPNDSIKVILSDTAFYTEGVNEWDTVRNGQLDIRAKLAGVSNGPVVLQLYKETEKYIRNGTAVLGKISVSYGLKREFELID